MKNQKLKSFISASCILLATFVHTVDARPKPERAATGEQKWAAWEQHQQLSQQSPYQGLSWRNIGPIMQGGRVVDIDYSRQSSDTFYVAYASGGLWKTTNNGQSFIPLFDQQPTTIMGDIAVDPQNSDIIWVGTGENNSSRSSYGGMGVMLSEDGGQHWQSTGLSDTDRIGRIVVDPNHSDRVFVASLGKLYTPGGQRGIYRTTDRGKSWQQVLAGDKTTGFVDLVIDSTNSNILYAASWQRLRRPWDLSEGGTESAIWKSVDGGDTWKKIVQGFPQGKHVGRIGLALSPSDSSILYASVDNQQTLGQAEQDLGTALSLRRFSTMDLDTFLQHSPAQIEYFIQAQDFETQVNAQQLIADLKAKKISLDELREDILDANPRAFAEEIKGLEVYRSNDAGQTWHRTHNKPIRDMYYSFGYYFGQIRVAPDNPEQIFLMGVNFISSTDGGKTYHTLNDVNVHVDYQSLWINPKQPKHMIVGNDGGVDVTYDRGEHWQKLDRQPVGQFYTIQVDMETPYNVYGGLQDNGTLMGSSQHDWETGEGWRLISWGDGMHVAVNPYDASIYYTGWQFGHYDRFQSGKRHDIRPRDKIGEPAYRYNWNTPLIMSQYHPDILYFGANKLLRSFDRGDHWQELSPDITQSKQRGDVPFATITTISESSLDPNIVWIGTDDGQAKVTANGGRSWIDVTRKLPKDRWVSRIYASAVDQNQAYISLNGYRDDDIYPYLYHTTNFGKSWKYIGTDLPHEAINVVKEDPINSQVVYVGTDRGVYVSLNQGKQWSALDQGLPNVPVHDLVVHPRDRELVVGTHGRSAWVVDVLPLQELTKEVQQQSMALFHFDDVQAPSHWYGQSRRWRPIKKAQLLPIHYWSKDEATIELTILDENDQPLYQHTLSPTHKGIHRFDWDFLVQESLALQAENHRNAEKTQLTFADQPYQQAVAHEQPLYLQPGQYQVQFQQGDVVLTQSVKLKKIPEIKPRIEPKKIRGR